MFPVAPKFWVEVVSQRNREHFKYGDQVINVITNLQKIKESGNRLAWCRQ